MLSGQNPNVFCKVEFNQLSCWLYSVPNLLVFWQLETLYLGGNHVRVVCVRECEELLKCVQRNRDSWLDFAVGSRLQAAKLKHTCQACQKLKSRTSCCTTGQKSQAGQAVCSQLELTTQPNREVKSPEHPIWEKLTFHIPSHPTIYIPLYPRF